jgi:hypothetical protein
MLGGNELRCRVPFYQYDPERWAAIAIVQDVIDRTGLRVPEHIRELLERAVTNDLVLQATERETSKYNPQE